MFSTTITSEMVNDFIAKALNAGIDLGGRILAALIIFIIGKFLINWANRLFATMLQKRKVDASIQSFLKSIVNITLLVMLFLAVIGKLGIELTSFAALLASVGVAVGMALSGNLSNFAGGVIILVFRPYKVGDYIEASTGASGTVTDIQIFHTVLTTPDNKVIFAPNGAMSGAVVTNYSRKETRRLDFTFGVEYGTDFNQAKAIILEIISKDSRILQDPAPFVELSALADSSVNITVRVWVNASDYWGVNFDMNKNVYATFNEKGISFPFPQLTVHQA
jgi:small conductance mechanosensitive channel